MRIAVIGRREITDEEHRDLYYLGQLLAYRGHEFITNGIDGAGDAARAGYESLPLPGRTSSVMRKDLIDYADKTLVYTDSDIDHLLITRNVFKHPKLVRIDGLPQLRRFIDEAALVMPTDRQPNPTTKES